MLKSLLLSFFAGVALTVVLVLVPRSFSPKTLPASVAYGVSNTFSTAATTGVASQINCTRSAIDARENAEINANNVFEQSSNMAYTNRAASLDRAYTQTSWKSVSAAAKASYVSFTNSIAQAQSAVTSADTAAKNTYTNAIAVCQAKNPSMPKSLSAASTTSQ